jgi:hypothetical protein
METWLGWTVWAISTCIIHEYLNLSRLSSLSEMIVNLAGLSGNDRTVNVPLSPNNMSELPSLVWPNCRDIYDEAVVCNLWTHEEIFLNAPPRSIMKSWNHTESKACKSVHTDYSSSLFMPSAFQTSGMSRITVSLVAQQGDHRGNWLEVSTHCDHGLLLPTVNSVCHTSSEISVKDGMSCSRLSMAILYPSVGVKQFSDRDCNCATETWNSRLCVTSQNHWNGSCTWEQG